MLQSSTSSRIARRSRISASSVAVLNMSPVHSGSLSSASAPHRRLSICIYLLGRQAINGGGSLHVPRSRELPMKGVRLKRSSDAPMRCDPSDEAAAACEDVRSGLWTRTGLATGIHYLLIFRATRGAASPARWGRQYRPFDRRGSRWGLIIEISASSDGLGVHVVIQLNCIRRAQPDELHDSAALLMRPRRGRPRANCDSKR